MLIFDENNDTIIIDNIHTPLISDYMYILDLTMMDFTLAPITSIEEIVCPTLTLKINNFSFNIPAYWHVLIFDVDTYQLDIVPVEETAGNYFHGLVYGINETSVKGFPIRVEDYDSMGINFVPALNKHQMLCHPVTDKLWMNFSSADTYNKYLKNKAVGDLV